MEKLLKNHLKDNNISFIEHKHSPVFTVEESKKIKLSLSCLHTKSLFLKSDSNKFYLVCIQADKRLHMKFLRKRLNHSKLHFSTAEELKSILNVSPGSVSIFTLINNSSSEVSLILDSEIFNSKTVGFHPNINTSTLELDNKNFHIFYNSLKQNKEIMKL